MTSDLIATLTLGIGSQFVCATYFLIMFYLSESIIKFASVVYEQQNFRHNLTSDMIVTLTLGIGTKLLCVTHLLIMVYLSVKFLYVCFIGF